MDGARHHHQAYGTSRNHHPHSTRETPSQKHSHQSAANFISRSSMVASGVGGGGGSGSSGREVRETRRTLSNPGISYPNPSGGRDIRSGGKTIDWLYFYCLHLIISIYV